MRVAVIGGGGVGGYLAARLQAVGHDVTLCVRTPFDALVVERDGQAETAPVAIEADPERVARHPWVVLAVKGQDTPGTGPWLDALAGPGTTVVVAQNGVDHVERVAPLAPGAAVLPVLVHITVEPIRRGRIRHCVGSRLVAPADGGAFAALLDGSGIEVELADDFRTAAWRKLLGNVVGNPITALTLRRSDVFRAEGIDDLGRLLLAEAIAVAAAEGARLAPDELETTIAMLRDLPGANGTSMLFDRLAGRPLEHESITGAVVRAGRRHGIPTPVNGALLALLRALA